jgi:hypothetical protein
LRLFKIGDSENFVEYKEQAFQSEHNESMLETWLEKNSTSIIEDSALLVIGRQVATNLGSYVDLLALDKKGNTAVIELKRGRTPRETIAQVLEYASWVEDLEYAALEKIFQDYTGDENQSLLDYHKAFFKLGEEGVAFNKDQRIVIVGYKITPEIRQMALFLRKKGIPTTCVEFGYFQNFAKERLMSVDIVVGKEALASGRITTGKRPPTDMHKFMNDLDENARPLFSAIFALAKQNQYDIGWGSVGFSMSLNLNDSLVGLLMGYPKSSVYSQILYTYFQSVLLKVKNGERLVASFKQALLKTGLFVPAGNEVKYVIRQRPAEEQVSSIIKLIAEFADQIKSNGLVE